MTSHRSDHFGSDGDRDVATDRQRWTAAAGEGESARILLVSEAALPARLAVARALEAAGHDLVSADALDEALATLDRRPIDLMVLDIGRRGAPGLDVLRQVRARSDMPVVVLSDLGGIEERITAFDLGCDDYLQRPVEAAEFSRRLRAVLRRCGTAPAHRITGPSGLNMKISEHTVYVGDTPVVLTPKEFDLLRVLLECRDEVVSPDELSTRIWGYETFGSRNFVEAHVSRLRAKLAQAGAPDVVTTIRGVGYVIRETPGRPLGAARRSERSSSAVE